jgi:YD repeat-containing protein
MHDTACSNGFDLTCCKLFVWNIYWYELKVEPIADALPPVLPIHNAFDYAYGYNNDASRSGLNLLWLTSYNGRGDLTGMTTPYSEAVSWSYLDNGWLSSQTTQAAVTSFSYNALGQLTDLTNSHGGVTLSDFNMMGSGHYDGAGNLAGQTVSMPGAPASYSGSTSYQYNGIDELTNEQSNRQGSNTNTFDYGNYTPETLEAGRVCHNGKCISSGDIKMSESSQHQDQPFWVVLSTDKPSQALIIEPFAIEWEMQPNARYCVYLKEQPPHLPEIVYFDGGIQIFGSLSVIYLNDTLLWNYANLDVKPPANY